jgi:HlyD family secretion protein
LRRIELRPGDPVTAGRTVLATFLPATPALLDTRTRAEAEARVKTAQAVREQAAVAIQRARDEAAFAQNELKRQREVAKFGGITDERLAASELEARTKEVQIRASELALQAAVHELEAARAVLQQITAPSTSGAGLLTLRSPISGVVLRVHQESEAQVPAGTPLIEVGNPAELEVVVDLLSADAVRVKPGFPALLSGWGGGVSLRGRVRRVEPSGFTKVSALGVDEQRVNVLLDFDDARARSMELGDGYRVEVAVIVWERENVLKVPTSALFRVGNEWAVFTVRDGRAAQTTVQIGQRNAVEAELISGLSEGDPVLVHPGDTVQNGVAVVPR